MIDNSEWSPRLGSNVEERLIAAEDRIRFLTNTLTRVTAERDEARAELAHMVRVGNALNTKRRHP